MRGTTIVAKAASSFTDDERRTFAGMVRAGGEVGGAELEKNVREAKCLVFLHVDHDLVGVAALKNPRTGYRTRISLNSGVDLAVAKYPFELGYIYVVEAQRRKGFSNRLVEAALAVADKSGVFATSRANNIPMHSALIKFGFENTGKSYPGSNQNMICVFLRRGA